jgi:hypothetical protein
MTTGITASLVDVVGDVGGDEGVGDGATDGGATLAGAEGVADAALGDDDGDGATDGAAATVKVVVPWSRSPSRAEAVVQRTVYVAGVRSPVMASRIVLASPASTVLPSAMTLPEASTSLIELFDGTTGSVNVITISVGGVWTVDLSLGVAVSSSAWPRAVAAVSSRPTSRPVETVNRSAMDRVGRPVR